MILSTRGLLHSETPKLLELLPAGDLLQSSPSITPSCPALEQGTSNISRLHIQKHRSTTNLASESHSTSFASTRQCLFLPPSRTKSTHSNERSPKHNPKTSYSSAQISSTDVSRHNEPSFTWLAVKRMVAWERICPIHSGTRVLSPTTMLTA